MKYRLIIYVSIHICISVLKRIYEFILNVSELFHVLRYFVNVVIIFIIITVMNII